MRILLYKWNAYNMKDLERNLIQKGHEIDTFSYVFTDYENSTECFSKLTKILNSETYDLVLSINYFPVISDACQACHTKYAAWTCDSPLLVLFTQSIFNSCNYLFSFDKWVYWTFKSYGLKHVYYLPLAVDTDRLHQLTITQEDKRNYTGDISFVGSLYEKNSYDDLTNLPDYLRGYLDAAILAQTKLSGSSILEEMITDELEEAFSNNVLNIESDSYFGGLPLIVASTFLGFKATAIERCTYLNRLSKSHPVHLYTKSNSEDLLLVKNHGPIDYHTQMPKVFRLSKINLNITVRSIKTGLPLRIFDVLGAGGFLLTNYQPELDYFFQNKKDLVYYTSEEDLYEKVDYYLSHEEERLAIARHGHETVKKYHTYDIRLDQMFQYLRM